MESDRDFFFFGGGMGQNLDVLFLYEGHSDLGFVGFAQLWDPLFSRHS